MPAMQRRTLLAAPLCLTTAALAQSDRAVDALRAGGVAVLLRHARTEPGVGDPPGFRAGVCSTQRNLSPEGRADAERIGRWFADQALRPAVVRSSAWCRCLDTARLAFGTVQPWAPLDSFFGDPAAEPERTRALRAGLAALRPGAFEVWVTHMVNISALAGESVAMGAALVLRAGTDRPEIVGRLDTGR